MSITKVRGTQSAASLAFSHALATYPILPSTTTLYYYIFGHKLRFCHGQRSDSVLGFRRQLRSSAKIPAHQLAVHYPSDTDAPAPPQGIDLRFNTNCTAIAKNPSGGITCTLTDGSKLDVDVAMFATGRKPRTADLK